MAPKQSLPHGRVRSQATTRSLRQRTARGHLVFTGTLPRTATGMAAGRSIIMAVEGRWEIPCRDGHERAVPCMATFTLPPLSRLSELVSVWPCTRPEYLLVRITGSPSQLVRGLMPLYHCGSMTLVRRSTGRHRALGSKDTKISAACGIGRSCRVQHRLSHVHWAMAVP